MTVLSYDVDDRFIIRVVKYLDTNPDNKWANSYEAKAITAGTETELLALGETIVDFEAAFHHEAVIFDRILISTWEADSVPYDPETFISSTLTANGVVAPATDPVPLNTALSVARIASSGRFGHLFFRGCLAEGQVEAPAGVSTLVSRPTIQGLIDAAISSSGLDDYINPSTIGGTLGLVMINKTGAQVRLINQLRVQGVTTLPTDHAWFNRTTP